MTNLPAKLSDTAKNPFFVVGASFIALVVAVITIARRHHS